MTYVVRFNGSEEYRAIPKFKLDFTDAKLC
jgi:hypothetical protein